MIDTVVVHCSASPQGRGDDASTIHSWHLERGFSGIGYHYVIIEDGSIEVGRPEYWQGAHAGAGGNNIGTLGICLIGEGGDATDKQMRSLSSLLVGLKHKYDGIEVVGHGDLDPNKSKCPGFDVIAWWETIK